MGMGEGKRTNLVEGNYKGADVHMLWRWVAFRVRRYGWRVILDPVPNLVDLDCCVLACL